MTPDDAVEQKQTKTDERKKAKASLECSDLKAQWSMADVTFWAFCAGLAGIALITLTWIATREAVTVSKNAAKDELRAYVEVKTAFFGPNIIVKAVNTGSTPARWFEIGAVSKVFKTQTGIDWDTFINFDEVESFQRWPALATDLTASLLSKDERENITKARAESNALLVFGTVRYETVFGEIFETQFAFATKSNFSLDKPLSRVPTTIKAFQPASKK